MYKFTLTVLFNQDKSKVLMCEHKKFGKLNFIGGKIGPDESILEATLRELYEETGIKGEDTKGLMLFRHEVVELYGIGKSLYNVYPDFDMYITAGVLKHDVELKSEKNPLLWVDVTDTETLLNANGDGHCYTFMREAMKIMDMVHDEAIIQ